MTDQHRATPEQWAAQEKWSSPPDSDPYALCLLELRDRVEALEKGQRKAAMDELRAASADCRPATTGSLVDRVIDAMDEHCGVNRYAEARAAIREVAAWLRETGDNIAIADAMVLEQEADR